MNHSEHHLPDSGAVSPELVKQAVEKAYVKYPDLHVTVEDMIAEGDKVMARALCSGTDSSTGKKIEFKNFWLWRIADGKIAEFWGTITPPPELD